MNGNLPNIMARMSAHNAAIMDVFQCVTERAHRGNPAAALRVQVLHGLPLLLNCLFSCRSSSKTWKITKRQRDRQRDKLTVSFVWLCLEKDRSEQVRIDKDWSRLVRTGQE